MRVPLIKLVQGHRCRYRCVHTVVMISACREAVKPPRGSSRWTIHPRFPQCETLQTCDAMSCLGNVQWPSRRRRHGQRVHDTTLQLQVSGTTVRTCSRLAANTCLMLWPSTAQLASSLRLLIPAAGDIATSTHHESVDLRILRILVSHNCMFRMQILFRFREFGEIVEEYQALCLSKKWLVPRTPTGPTSLYRCRAHLPLDRPLQYIEYDLHRIRT